VKFLSIIHDVLKIAPMEYIKQSSDEVDIRGPESKYDSRKINSYPSKVGALPFFSTCRFIEYAAVLYVLPPTSPKPQLLHHVIARTTAARHRTYWYPHAANAHATRQRVWPCAPVL